MEQAAWGRIEHLGWQATSAALTHVLNFGTIACRVQYGYRLLSKHI